MAGDRFEYELNLLLRAREAGYAGWEAWAAFAPPGGFGGVNGGVRGSYRRARAAGRVG